MPDPLVSPRIVAFDPGGTTGFCGATTMRNQFEYRMVEGQFTPTETYKYLDALQPQEIVMERFVFRRNKTKVDYTPVEVIGRIRQWAEDRQVPIVQEYTLSVVKHYFTDKRLQQLGFWFEGKQHARDAARHFLYYVTFGEGKKYGLKFDTLAST